jgi:hypothetical protein
VWQTKGLKRRDEVKGGSSRQFLEAISAVRAALLSPRAPPNAVSGTQLQRLWGVFSTAGLPAYVRAVTTHDAATAATTLVSLVALAGGVSHAPLELLRTHPVVRAAVAAMSADERGRYLVDATRALPAPFGACAALLRALVGPTLQHDLLSTVRAATGATFPPSP